MIINEFLERLVAAVSPYRGASRFVVAYSGGIDSSVLLHQLVQLRKKIVLPPVCAIHIHHGLNPQADAWQNHCNKNCKQLGVDFYSFAVTINQDSTKSIEELARESRYSVFENFVEKTDVLLMAHHQEDQAETMLLRLLRGAGPKGLAGMPSSRRLGQGVLVRPFLDVSKDTIRTYADHHQLVWVEDDSNQDNQFDRNFLRNDIFPLIKKRWPHYTQSWVRAANLCKETDELCTEWARLDWQNVQGSKTGTLSVKALEQLSVLRQRNVVRYWLAQHQLTMPSQAQLDILLTDVLHAKADAQPLLAWPGVEIRRFQDNLYAMPPLQFDSSVVVAPFEWDMETPLALSIGELIAQQTKGDGIALKKITEPLAIRYRQGGERCKPAGRVGSHPVKKLFQEYGVEPWLRDQWPLLYMGETLIAAPNLWVCEEFQAQKKEKSMKLVIRPIEN